MALLLTFAVVRRSSWRWSAVIGLKFYVRPKEAIERVAGVAVDAARACPVHPSLAFRQLLQKIGRCAAASPKDVTIMQRRLIRAGFRGPNALKVLYGSKLALVVICCRSWLRCASPASDMDAGQERSWPCLLLRRPDSSGPMST